MNRSSLHLYIRKQLGFDLECLDGGASSYRVPLFKHQAYRNHFEDRPLGASVRHLVIHYTVDSLSSCLEIMTRDVPEGRVSSHYVISEQEAPLVPGGALIQVVPEDEKAWHAGVSHWGMEENLNNTSVGIELVNVGRRPDGTWAPFHPDQIHALGLLAQQVVQRHPIPPENVVGHSDIAPGRKEDPGPLFPWGTLYHRYGIGAWLGDEEQDPSAIHERYQPGESFPQQPDMTFFCRCLRRLGYPVLRGDSIGLQACLRAFQAHFSRNQRPDEIGSPLNQEDMLWAWGLSAKYHPVMD